MAQPEDRATVGTDLSAELGAKTMVIEDRF